MKSRSTHPESTCLASTVLAVNVGRAEPLRTGRGDETALSGIAKRPAEGPVLIGALGLAGDQQVDRSVHGGPDKAVYVYSRAHTVYWRGILERPDLDHGTFGENLSVEALGEESVHIGDRFRVGGCLVEVTQPREPCWKLGARLGSPTLPKRFLASGRVGFYLRVLEPGAVTAGDTMTREHIDAARLSVADVHRIRHFDRDDLEGVRRALDVAALSEAWRLPLAARLGR